MFIEEPLKKKTQSGLIGKTTSSTTGVGLTVTPEVDVTSEGVGVAAQTTVNEEFIHLREAAKGLFFSCMATKRGGGELRALSLRKKNFFILFPIQKKMIYFNNLTIMLN